MTRYTSSGGKRLNHRKGFLNRGIVIRGHAFPVFKVEQKPGSKAWDIVQSITKPNYKANMVYDLQKKLQSVEGSAQDLKEAYVDFYLKDSSIKIPKEVTEKAYELANNSLASAYNRARHALWGDCAVITGCSSVWAS